MLPEWKEMLKEVLENTPKFFLPNAMCLGRFALEHNFGTQEWQTHLRVTVDGITDLHNVRSQRRTQ